jgi:hypothetical protein
MRRMVAVLIGALAAAVLAQGALASGDGKLTLGPAGYDGPGAKRTLVAAGTANVVLGSDDHVVICHATGGPNGTGFVQIAPSASGVVNGHGGHEADRDVIPPFSFSDKKGSDGSLAAGQNWNSANAAMYANGCRAAGSPPPPTDVCPNIQGTQATVPSGMSKDAAGNCVTPPTDVCPNIEGIQSAVPTGMTKDASGNCVTVVTLTPQPPTTVTIEKVVVNTMVVKTVKVVTKVKAKKKVVKKAKVVKKVKKAKAKKKIRVKGVSKKFTPRVLPHTR